MLCSGFSKLCSFLAISASGSESSMFCTASKTAPVGAPLKSNGSNLVRQSACICLQPANLTGRSYSRAALHPPLQLQLQLCLAFWATMALLTSLLLAICPLSSRPSWGLAKPRGPSHHPPAVAVTLPLFTGHFAFGNFPTFRPTAWQQG